MFLFALPARAATLELALEKSITSAKEDIAVLVAINSEGQDVNTAQATISFPASLLEVTKIDRSSSVFSFWLQEPSFDNAKGTIRFAGGAISGFNGSSLKLMRISFRVKGSGSGRLGITDGAITASDGTGSNVYTTAKGLDINIPTTAQFEAVKVESAQRAATIAKELPARLGLDVPFYPDSTKWNNRSASFQAKWLINSDTAKAAVALNKNQNFTPDASAEALIGSKIFPALEDGIWYIHLRVANNIGWSPTLHYRLAVDTTPPASFKITSNSGFSTGDPKPTISFSSSDLVSGIKEYAIKLDGAVVATTDKTTYQFNPILPGTHQLVVSAIDNAGNATSQTESLEILPITSPEITYVSRQVNTEDGEITAGGTSVSAVEVVAQIQNSQKQIVAEQVAPVDTNGNWSVIFNNPLTKGNYYLIVTARDKNMASSFPVTSDSIKVRPKPVLTLGSLRLTQTWFFIILIIVLLGSFGLGYFTYRKWKGQLGRRVVIAQRDVVNAFDNLEKDVDKLLNEYNGEKITKSEVNEMKSILKNMKESIKKFHQYVVDNIREINK